MKIKNNIFAILLPILIFLILFEILSFFSSKLNLLIFNKTPNIYLGNSKFNLGIEWRNEKNIWGAWHKKNYLQEHQSDCFDVTYLTNSVGARDEEFTIKNNENKKRFILLGDSMMEGYGINKNEMFETILENENNFSLLNFGSGGDFGTLQYYLIYKNLAKNYEHEGVIVVYFPQNDLTDNNYKIWTDNGWNKFGDKERFRPYSNSINNKKDYFIPENAHENDNFQFDINEKKSIFVKFLINYTWSSNSIRSILYMLRSINKSPDKDLLYSNHNYSSFYNYDQKLLEDNIHWLKSIYEEAKKKENYLIILPSKNDMKMKIESKNKKNIHNEIESLFDLKKYNVKIINLIDYLPNNYQKIFLECDDHYSFYGNKWMSNIFMEFIK